MVRKATRRDPPPSRPLSFTKTGPEKGDGAYPNSDNTLGFRQLFNIDVSTPMNAKKDDTQFLSH